MEAKQATTTAYGGGGDPFGNTLWVAPIRKWAGHGGERDRPAEGRTSFWAGGGGVGGRWGQGHGRSIGASLAGKKRGGEDWPNQTDCLSN